MFYAMLGMSRDLVISSEDPRGAGVPEGKWSQSQV